MYMHSGSYAWKKWMMECSATYAEKTCKICTDFWMKWEHVTAYSANTKKETHEET